jgi:hypothetical protein
MKLDIILFILSGIIILCLLWPERRKQRKSNTERRKPRKSNTKRQVKSVKGVKMANIKEVTISTSHIIETDDKEYPCWRRHGKGSWENLMGNSWEEMEPPEGLEEAFNEFMSHQLRGDNEILSNC